MRLANRFCSLVLSIMMATTLAALPPVQGGCDRDADTGTIFCGLGCESFSTGSSCWPVEGVSAPAYCWQAIFVDPPGAGPACHAGNYEPCCDTNGGF